MDRHRKAVGGGGLLQVVAKNEKRSEIGEKRSTLDFFMKNKNAFSIENERNT